MSGVAYDWADFIPLGLIHYWCAAITLNITLNNYNIKKTPIHFFRFTSLARGEGWTHLNPGPASHSEDLPGA